MDAKALKRLLLFLLLLPSLAFAQPVKPPINAVAGPTTSAQFRGIITDPLGTGSVLFGTSIPAAEIASIALLRANTVVYPAVVVGGYYGTGTPGGGTFVYVSGSVVADDSCNVFVDAGGRRYFRLDPSYSVLDCGAKGDGSTDDTAAIVAAEAAAYAATRTLTIPGRTYKITSTILIRA